MHTEQHPLAGKTVKIKGGINEIGGEDYHVEDWQDKVFGKSWMFCDGNPAAMKYAIRAGLSRLPTNNDCLYGKIGMFGHIVHLSEIEK